MKCILVILVLILIVFILVIRIVFILVLVVLCDLCCRFEDVIVAIGGVVRLSPRGLLQTLAETVLVRVILVRISIAHLG